MASSKYQKAYLLFAVLLGLGLGYYVYSTIIEKTERKKATVELATWMPASRQIHGIYQYLDRHNKEIITSATKVACECAQNNVEHYDLKEIENMNSEDLMTNMMPFVECMQKKANRFNLENLDESSFNTKTQKYYNQVDADSKRSVFLFLLLIDMKETCASDSYLFMKLIREEYEGK